MDLHAFHIFLITMSCVALIVFISLYFVKAGYGMFRTSSWGLTVSNKLGWFLMELPVFLLVGYLWYTSDRRFQTVELIFFLFFELHYFQRAIVYPFLLKGKSRMPVVIMCMAMLFNVFNGFIQGYWLFHLAPVGSYADGWLMSAPFIIGTVLFFTGMAINWHSDYIIRHLRKPGDTNHYLPNKGLYRYVTSANYFGEVIEWTGFAILTWSYSGLVFLWWTLANLVPRANSIWHRYHEEFGDAVGNRKRIFPFIY